jgi:hypothetical protein
MYKKIRLPVTKEKTLRKLLVLTVLIGLLGTAGVAIADPNLLTVPAHRHFIQTNNGLVEVGPRLCDDPALQKAFNQFHANIHSHTLRDGTLIGAIGPVAPGLHNDIGAELEPQPCSFTP